MSDREELEKQRTALESEIKKLKERYKQRGKTLDKLDIEALEAKLKECLEKLRWTK